MRANGTRNARTRTSTERSRFSHLRFEPLEERSLLAVGMIDLGPSDNVALDQPRVAIEVLEPQVDEPEYNNPAHWGSVGPGIFNTMLLDTGANGILAMATAVGDMEGPPYPYETEGVFVESGVAGDHLMDISVPYRFDFAGTDGIRNTIFDARLMSDADNDFSIFGPWGLVGMPAMVDRVTTLDMSGWSTTATEPELFMRVNFSPDLPPDNGHRYSVAVDNRLQFDPLDQTRPGDDPPVWADIPFLTAIPTYNGVGIEGNFLFDTGAQVSVISEQLAFDLGLDANGNGTLDDEATRFETVGGVGGTVTAPVVYIDEVRVPTEQGLDLVWTDLQWLVLDIEVPGETSTLDGVFGSDLLTSGWVEAYFEGAEDGYFQQLHFDFRDMETNGTGSIHFDLTPAIDVVIPPGPSVRTLETLGYTTVSEGGSEDYYRLVLTEAPTDDVEVSFTSSGGQVLVERDGAPGSTSVTFTPSDWNVPQLVRVVAVNDDLAEGPHADLIVHTVSSNDVAYNALPAPNIDVQVLDDDLSLLIFGETDDSTEVSEDGSTDTYTVALKSAPAGTVYVDLTSPDNQLFAFDPTQTDELSQSTLVFTSGNWNVPQTVEVRAIDDATQEGPHAAQIVHEVVEVTDSFNIEELGVALLSVDILDNDVGPMAIFESDNSTEVSEAGQTDSYTIVLNEAPAATVRIDLETPILQVTAVNNAEQLKTYLEFTTSNWATPQTVLVEAINDEVDEGPHSARIVHSVTSDDVRYNGLALPEISVQIVDDDLALLIFEETDGSTTYAEGDNTVGDTYTVRLSREVLSASVGITNPDQQVVDQNGQFLTDSNPIVLLFTSSDWNIPQPVTLFASDDTAEEGPHSTQLVHDVVEAISLTEFVEGQTVFSVNIVDNDVNPVVIVETNDSSDVSEAGQTDSYTVVLNSAPTHPVRFDLDTPDGQIRAVSSVEPLNTYIEFTPTNWSTPQTVLVEALDDDVDEGGHAARIVHRISSGDPAFDGLSIPPIVIQVADNDTAGLTVTETDGSTVVGSGGQHDTYEIVLTSEPTDDVRVEFGDGGGQLQVVDNAQRGNSFVIFTADDWDIARTIRVSTKGQHGFGHGTTEIVVMHELLSTDANYRGTQQLTVEVLESGTAYTDIVGRISETGDWIVAKSDGTGFSSTNWGKWTPGATWLDVHVGDFNGDGRDDIVGRVAETGYWYVAESTGSGYTTTRWGKWSKDANWGDLLVGDFNGDGYDDIASRITDTGYWYVGASTGSSFTTTRWGKWSKDANWGNVHVGDFDGDGYDDIASRITDTGYWYVGASTGSSFTTTRWGKWSKDANWGDVLIGDFTGDGYDDIASRIADTGYWYIGASTGNSFATARWTKWSKDAIWSNVSVGDFNGDGYDDIASRIAATGYWYVGASTGSSFATTRWGKWSKDAIWGDVLVGDFTGDGYDDIASRIVANGYWYVGTSTGSSFATTKWGKWSKDVTWLDVQVGDFDGTGAAPGGAAIAAPAAADLFWSEVGSDDDEVDSLLVENQVVNLLKMEE